MILMASPLITPRTTMVGSPEYRCRQSSIQPMQLHVAASVSRRIQIEAKRSGGGEERFDPEYARKVYLLWILLLILWFLFFFFFSISNSLEAGTNARSPTYEVV